MSTMQILQNIDKYSALLADEKLVGVMVIKLPEWNIKSYSPILLLSQNKFWLGFEEKLVEFDISQVKSISLKDKLVEISIDGEDLELGLVEIDSTFDNISKDYSEKFATLLEFMKNHNSVDFRLLSQLPNQLSIGHKGNKDLVLIITGVLFIAISLFLMTLSPTIAFFLLIGGLIVSIYGLILLILNKAG